MFAETEHSPIFKQMGTGNMSHFKQLTTYAIPFLLITWLRQLKEHFFFNSDNDFFKGGMYTAISSRPKNTTVTNNIWMMVNPKQQKGSHNEKVDSLAFFKPKKKNKVCVTRREWAAVIFKCEFQPPSLDSSSLEILKASHLKKKKYEMKQNNLNWATVHVEEETKSKSKIAINVSTMDGKDLYRNVCEALNANALNTKNKHERTVINEAKMSMVEMVMRKFDTTCMDFKKTMKFLTYVPIATVLEMEKHGEIAKMGKKQQ